MKKKSFQISYFIIFILLISFYTGCKASKEMTTEKWCKIQKELADIGINKYFNAFIDKEYEEMAESYVQYVKDSQAVYKKYNTTGALLTKWQAEHREEITSHLESHPEIDFRKIYGDKYNKFSLNIYYFLEEKVKRETEPDII